MQEAEQLDPCLGFLFLYIMCFLTLPSNFSGWVDLRHLKVLKKT